MNKYGFQLLFAFGFGAIVSGVFWILESPNSPLPQYLQSSATTLNTLALLNLVPIIIEYVLSGNPHGGNDTIGWTASFIQWSLVGFFLAVVWKLFRRANPRKRKAGTQLSNE